MPNLSVEARALAFVIAHPASTQTTAAVPEAVPRASSPRPAVRRCCNAWQRAFDAYVSAHKANTGSEVFARDPASVAYCNAMPILSGFDSIRDFIACVAQGVLIGAIPESKAGHLLYSARMALATIQSKAKLTGSPPLNPPPAPTEQPQS